MHKAHPTKIGWADWVWNPLACACRHGCEYCYMKRWHKAGGKAYPAEPQWRDREFNSLCRVNGGRIFVCDDTDLFGDWIPSAMIIRIINGIRELAYEMPESLKSRFFFLTKNPARYAEFEFPENCWLGTTLDRPDMKNQLRSHLAFHSAHYERMAHNPRRNTFFSCEPILGDLARLDLPKPDWMILGANSRAGAEVPQQEWIDKVVAHCDTVQIPVFIKDNLRRHYPDAPWAHRKERP